MTGISYVIRSETVSNVSSSPMVASFYPGANDVLLPRNQLKSEQFGQPLDSVAHLVSFGITLKLSMAIV